MCAGPWLKSMRHCREDDAEEWDRYEALHDDVAVDTERAKYVGLRHLVPVDFTRIFSETALVRYKGNPFLLPTLIPNRPLLQQRLISIAMSHWPSFCS